MLRSFVESLGLSRALKSTLDIRAYSISPYSTAALPLSPRALISRGLACRTPQYNLARIPHKSRATDHGLQSEIPPTAASVDPQ